MLKAITHGLVAGAVGTLALDISTYLDMSVRGRGPSSAPSDTIRAISVRAGIPRLSQPENQSDAKTKHRRSGLGSLMGYGVGLGVGALYGALRSRFRNLPLPLAAVLLGAAAMAAGDIPPTKLGVTDPATWSPADWASDIIPHMAYGLAAALTYEAIAT